MTKFHLSDRYCGVTLIVNGLSIDLKFDTLRHPITVVALGVYPIINGIARISGNIVLKIASPGNDKAPILSDRYCRVILSVRVCGIDLKFASLSHPTTIIESGACLIAVIRPRVAQIKLSPGNDKVSISIHHYCGVQENTTESWNLWSRER